MSDAYNEKVFYTCTQWQYRAQWDIAWSRWAVRTLAGQDICTFMVHMLIEIILRFGGVGGSTLPLYKLTAALCWFGMVIAPLVLCVAYCC